MKYIDELLYELGEEKVLIDELMKNHTTFKVGGPVDIMIIPENTEDIKKTIDIAKKHDIPFMTIGNGSNLLVKDGGIRGIVIKISDNMSSIEIEDNYVKIQSGLMMNKAANAIMEASLEGFEFASGIPGTLGGAITMNAGAYDGEIKDIVKSVECMDRKGNIRTYSNEEMHFGYRMSRVQEDDLIVLNIVLELKEGSYNEIKMKIDELTEKRTSKQPLELASGGSTFKRPKGYYAGKLIEDSGLRGYRYKNVGISQKHCGFVVNYGESKAQDILDLIEMVKKIVYDNFKVELETEIRILGEDL
ncbi:MAG: UDP-N-acetylmuramate dehydrogenase [Andreesenia angusta]|nr:UDP-N-acetylmuramate dehydrogenase [Andreesenia angusta]